MTLSIDRRETVTINHHSHRIHIYSNDSTLPMLVFIHGGPGVPNRHSIMSRHLDLARHFSLVCYDQRGTGGSYYGTDKNSLRLDVFIEDLKGIIEYAGQCLAQSKAVLCGGSWGTEIGTRFSYLYPNLVRAYVGYGQVVDGYLNETITYNFAVEKATEAKDDEDLKALEEIGPPVKGCYHPVYEGLMKQRSLLGKYGGSSMEKKASYASSAKAILFSREYTLKDKIGIMKGIRFSLENAWPYIVNYHFMDDQLDYQIPIYFFQGVHDFNTPSSLVEQYFDVIHAPLKKLIWFEHSAHGPLGDEPEKFKDCLVNIVLKETDYDKDN